MDSIALKIINWDAFYAEEEKIEQIKDEAEKEVRHRLLDAIWEKITEWDTHVFEYEYEQHWNQLIERGISFTRIRRSSAIAKWNKLFAISISNEDKKKVHYEQFKWHLFSFHCLKALEQDEARKAFDTCSKSTVYLFFQCADEAYIVENASLLKSVDFDVDCHLSKADVFIFDRKAEWTYVHTHEATCGPYFYCAK